MLLRRVPADPSVGPAPIDNIIIKIALALHPSISSPLPSLPRALPRRSLARSLAGAPSASVTSFMLRGAARPLLRVHYFCADCPFGCYAFTPRLCLCICLCLCLCLASHLLHLLLIVVVVVVLRSSLRASSLLCSSPVCAFGCSALKQQWWGLGPFFRFASSAGGPGGVLFSPLV